MKRDYQAGSAEAREEAQRRADTILEQLKKNAQEMATHGGRVCAASARGEGDGGPRWMDGGGTVGVAERGIIQNVPNVQNPPS